MQMSPVGLSFGRQTIVHLRNNDKFPKDAETAEKLAKNYLTEDIKISNDGSSLTITPTDQDAKKHFLTDAGYIKKMIDEGMDITYTTKISDLDSMDNPYLVA